MDKVISYLKFELVPSNTKTKSYDVYNTYDVFLGNISFYPRWRKYVFNPENDCYFDDSCLSEISDKLKELTKEWRESLKCSD